MDFIVSEFLMIEEKDHLVGYAATAVLPDFDLRQ